VVAPVRAGLARPRPQKKPRPARNGSFYQATVRWKKTSSPAGSSAGASPGGKDKRPARGQKWWDDGKKPGRSRLMTGGRQP